MKGRHDVNGKKTMDEATNEMDPESREKALRIAHKYQIGEEDPAWVLVRLVVESLGGIEKITNEGTKALREASVAVTSATAAEVKASRELAAREIVKMQEAAKRNIANALGGTLENEIRNAVGRIQSQSNRPLHRKWLIALGVGLPIAVALGGWGLWSFYTYAKNVGAADTAAYANPVSKSFYHLMECDEPGWKTKWRADGKELWCYPHADKDGNQYGWRIR